MNITMLLSLVSLVGFTLTAVILIKRKSNIKLSNSVFIPLFLSLLLYDFIVISNFLEHAGITAYFDPLEDIAEIVFTLLFLFFVNNWRKDRSEARFREIFKLAPMPLAEITMDGKVVRVNEILLKNLKELFGITIDNVPTINDWWEIAYPDPKYRHRILLQWQKDVELARRTGTPINSGEREFTCSDGSKRTIIVGISVIGENLLISMLDITDRKQAEEERERLQNQLLQAQKMEAIGILAGGVAHDFNNILGTIMGYAELTMEQMNAENPFRRNISKILDATHRSTELVSQLLVFARKQTVTPVLLELNKAVETTLSMIRRLIGEDIELIWLPAKKPCTVRMDPIQLDQILTNLCVNARDAIDNIGQITIKTGIIIFDDKDYKSHIDCTPGRYVLLSIADNGNGMDKETAQHIFEPFYTTKEVGRGTGLGLATVYGIVKQSNGFIELDSEPGLGTTFNIYLPWYSDESKINPSQEAMDIPHGKSETILLVEDDPEFVRMSQTMLDRLEYTVLTANTPNEAIKLAGENRHEIDMILTDVVMPEMNGRELIEQLLLVMPNVKYLFMSGYTADVIINRGVSGRDEHFIQKPFTLKEIAVKVRQVLDAQGE